MHFFGSWGAISFLLGFIFTIKILWEKIDAAWFTKVALKRDVTEQRCSERRVIENALAIETVSRVSAATSSRTRL